MIKSWLFNSVRLCVMAKANQFLLTPYLDTTKIREFSKEYISLRIFSFISHIRFKSFSYLYSLLEKCAHTKRKDSPFSGTLR